ncbi:MAG: transposase [Cyanobacteriota/Melainabacteria group bacterium]
MRAETDLQKSTRNTVQRAQCENWIKDLKNYLRCDRTSCQEFNANQLRLLLHTFAYILLWKLKMKAVLKNSTIETVRLQLIKVGVLVTESVRRISLKLSSNHPWQEEFRRAWGTG